MAPPCEDEEALLKVEVEARPWPRRALFASLLVVLAGLAGLGTGIRTRGVASDAAVSSLEMSWEDIPDIDKVVARAEGLKPIAPEERELQDLFYGAQPSELPWIRTECVIDVVQATAYLGQAVVFLYKAIAYDSLQCPDNSPVGCAVSVAGFLTSMFWIGSYLSFAANACSDAVNSKALCGGDWLALMADFGEVATAGAAVKEDCDFGTDWATLLNITGDVPGWQAFEPAGASPVEQAIRKVTVIHEAQRNRNFDIAQCVFDVTNSASYIVRVILQIRSAASSCPEPRNCAINIMNIISSFAWISQFTALAVSDCQETGSQTALCTADISDLVAALTNGPAAGVATTSDCADLPIPAQEVKRIGAE
ncbi:unnamed protein product [Effrenium voratum]|nr:unnamed protein product [Effrenium voratum]